MLQHKLGLFDRAGPLTLDGFARSGAEYMPEFKPFIDGKTIVCSPVVRDAIAATKGAGRGCLFGGALQLSIHCECALDDRRGDGDGPSIVAVARGPSPT